jgi:DNA segregation ATPase FtsK/SpoIIIE-like protein
VGYLDIYHLLERLLGASSALIALIVLWFVALYLTLRISYRAILSKVRESVPSIRNMRDAIIPSDDDEDIIPAKRGRADDEYKKKAEELERKLTAIQNKKTPEVIEKPKSNTNALMGALGLTKKIPLETPEGKKIESNHPAKAVDFGTWDFPSLKLLNDIEHINVVSPEEIEEKSLLIEKTFLQFGIDVQMEDECV